MEHLVSLSRIKNVISGEAILASRNSPVCLTYIIEEKRGLVKSRVLEGLGVIEEGEIGGKGLDN